MKKTFLLLIIPIMLLFPVIAEAYYKTYVEVEITGLSWIWDGETSNSPYTVQRHDWCIPADTNMRIAGGWCESEKGCESENPSPPQGDTIRKGFLKPMCKSDVMISNLVSLHEPKPNSQGTDYWVYSIELDRAEERLLYDTKIKNSNGYYHYPADEPLTCNKFCMEKTGYYYGIVDSTWWYFNSGIYWYNDYLKNNDFSKVIRYVDGVVISGCNCLKESPIDIRIDFWG